MDYVDEPHTASHYFPDNKSTNNIPLKLKKLSKR
jgi:hypothetical protein